MPTARPHVQVKRIYEDLTPGDGVRVLVDRLWPRGISKERAALDEWCKPIAPSSELRRWYAHDPAKFAEFTRRYLVELGEPERAAELGRLRELARGSAHLALLTATKDVQISAAAVLATEIRSGGNKSA